MEQKTIILYQHNRPIRKFARVSEARKYAKNNPGNYRIMDALTREIFQDYEAPKIFTERTFLNFFS